MITSSEHKTRAHERTISSLKRLANNVLLGIDVFGQHCRKIWCGIVRHCRQRIALAVAILAAGHGRGCDGCCKWIWRQPHVMNQFDMTRRNRRLLKFIVFYTLFFLAVRHSVVAHLFVPQSIDHFFQLPSAEIMSTPLLIADRTEISSEQSNVFFQTSVCSDRQPDIDDHLVARSHPFLFFFN